MSKQREKPSATHPVETRPLWVLVAQDGAVDAELVQQELTQAGFQVAVNRAETSEEVSRALLEDYADRQEDEGKDFFACIRTASQHMARLIDDTLRLSRVSRHELKQDKVDLSQIAQTSARGGFTWLSSPHRTRSMTSFAAKTWGRIATCTSPWSSEHFPGL